MARAPACEQTSPAPVSAATRASAGSAPDQVSLSRSAPAAIASTATSARQVSMEITTSGKAARTAAMVPTVRRISSITSTSSPGPAFTPPMSMISAPSVTARSTARSALSWAKVAPRSKNESGVRLTMAITASSPGANVRLPSRNAPVMLASRSRHGRVTRPALRR